MSVPYLGSKISLVSKSGIRYEGILHSIDAENSQVALQNVRSFGTEDRKEGSEAILPSNEVWECIIFRGADIQDLHVCEAPPAPAMTVATPQYPAIVSSMSTPASQQFPSNPYGQYQVSCRSLYRF